MSTIFAKILNFVDKFSQYVIMPLKGEHSYDAEATEQQIKDIEKRIANLTETLEITVTKSIVLKIKELETELEKSKVLLKKEQLKSSPVVLTREQIMYFLKYAIQTPYKEKLISLIIVNLIYFFLVARGSAPYNQSSMHFSHELLSV